MGSKSSLFTILTMASLATGMAATAKPPDDKPEPEPEDDEPKPPRFVGHNYYGRMRVGSHMVCSRCCRRVSFDARTCPRCGKRLLKEE